MGKDEEDEKGKQQQHRTELLVIWNGTRAQVAQENLNLKVAGNVATISIGTISIFVRPWIPRVLSG